VSFGSSQDWPVWLHRLRLRARAMAAPGHDRALGAELQLHIDLLTDEYVAGGLSLPEARARAHREFGNTTSVQETSHELYSLRALEGLGKDVACALRAIRRSPGFTAIAVVSLAVGIGVATTTFSVIDALMLRGLPVPQPERLVAFSAPTAATWSRWSYAAFQQWVDAPDAVFDATAVYNLNDLEQPRIVGIGTARVSLVAGNYFAVLGVPAIAGRVFDASDDGRPSGRPVAVVSHAFMERQFGTTAAILGRSLVVNGAVYEVVGVGRRGFTGDWVGQPIDIWLPLSAYPAITRGPADALSDASSARWLRIIARLRDGVTLEQATASANLLFDRWRSAQSAAPFADRSDQIALSSAARGYAPLRQQYAQPLMIGGAIVALVLVVACANFINLLYGRSQSRQQEFAVRLVMGAGHWRIARQALAECVLLASLAGLGGLLVSSWATTAALKRFAATIQPLELAAGVDGRALSFAAACVGLVVLFGLAPSMKGALISASQHLSQAAMRQRRRNMVGRIFLVTQLALCAVLLVGAGLMVRTVDNLRSQSLGFHRDVLLVTLAPGQAGYTGEAAAMFLGQVRERLLAIRGIGSVSTTSAPLLDNRAYWVDSSERLTIDEGQPMAGARWTFAEVGPGFFDTMGIPLVRGRGLLESDFTSPADVVVINQSLARILFGSEDPLGQAVGMPGAAVKSVIVGVVNDVRQTSPRDQGLAVLYRPLRQPPPQVVLAIRTNGRAADAVDVVRHQLEAMDRDIPVVKVQTVEDVLNAAIAQERLLATFAAWLGMLVIIVTCVGLHALVDNDVAQRTHEIGVRLALGATRGGVAMLVLRSSGALVGVALCLGVPLSLAATRPLSSQLYGLRPDDPQTIASVIVLLLAVAFGAAIRPARSAARVDPVVLLRAD
jgi:predicted permease